MLPMPLLVANLVVTEGIHQKMLGIEKRKYTVYAVMLT
jgi:hypothetical protein